MATTATTQPSFVNIDLLPPVLFEKGKNPEDYLLKLNQHLLHISEWSQQLDLSVRNGWLVPNARVISISAEKVTANTIFTQDLFVGDEQNIQLLGTSNVIDVYDNQATPQLRTRIGKLGAGNDNWGQSWLNAAGTEIMRVGDTVFIDGAIITDATLTGAKIIDGEIINSKLDDLSVSTGKLQGNSVDENKRITVYSQSTSVNFGSISSGAMTRADRNFTHTLGRLPTVTSHVSNFVPNTGTAMFVTIRDTTSSNIGVSLYFINLSGAPVDPASVTVNVDYW